MSYKRVMITRFGGPEVLEVVEEPHLPEPGPGEVRVRVLAAGAAFTDVMIRKGKYPDVKEKPPFAPGYDIVGAVDKAGEGVTSFREGQRVADLTVIGGYSEYICLPQERLTPVPDGLDDAEAVSLILSYTTAYQLLTRAAGVGEGRSILVHGAGGAVGTAMLQIGRTMGLEMYGTEAKAKHGIVSQLGATPIDYTDDSWPERLLEEKKDGIDAVFDPIGGDSLKRSYRVLARGGTLAAFGFYNAVMGRGGSIIFDLIRLKWWDLLPNGKSTAFYSIQSLREKHPDWFREDLKTLFGLLSRGEIRPVIAERMHLRDAAKAHGMIESGEVRGKIVLIPGGE